MIKTLREKFGFSQEELAEKIGLSRSAIAMIENGTNQLSITNAKKLADIFEMDWRDFFED